MGLVAALSLGCGGEVYTDSEGESTTSAAPSTDTSADAGSSAGASATSSAGSCAPDLPRGPTSCDVFAQDCCAGQKCAAYDLDGEGWDGATCVDVTGDGQHGDPCTADHSLHGVDDCGPGVMCFFVDEDGVGVCVALCTGSVESSSCAPPSSTCVITGEGPLNLCLQRCNPLLQGCEGGQSCVSDPTGDGFICVASVADGMAPEGTPCEFANACNPGLMCVNPDFYPGPDCAGSIGCCAPFCDTGQPGACEGLSVAEAECVSFYAPEPAPEGFEAVGVCGVQG